MSKIIEKILPIEASNLEGYNGLVYKYTLQNDRPSPTNTKKTWKKGAWYTGAHGSDDPKKNINTEDGYWQNSKNEDFKLLFCDGISEFKLEILSVHKDWQSAKAEEGRLLLMGRKDIENGMSFNSKKSLNFIVDKEHLDREACLPIIEEIKKREYNKWSINYQPKKKFTKKNYTFLQVKVKQNKDQITIVKNSINDARGVVDLKKNQDVDPITVFCTDGQWNNGLDEVNNGNVTTTAILKKDCKAEYVPEIRIPYEDHKHLCEADRRYIALRANVRPKKVRSYTDTEAAVKYFFDHISKGGLYEHDTKENRKLLREDFNLNSTQVSDVMKKVKDMVYKSSLTNSHMPGYDTAQEVKKCNELRVAFPNEIIFSASVKMPDKLPARILKEYSKEVDEAEAALPARKPKTTIRMLINWQQSKTDRDLWIKKGDGSWDTLVKQWDRLGTNIKLKYEELPLVVDDKKGATDIALQENTEE